MYVISCLSFEYRRCITITSTFFRGNFSRILFHEAGEVYNLLHEYKWLEISTLVFIAEEGKGSKEKGEKKKNEILIKVVDISRRS